ncbi:RNA-binding domain-containing protein [Xylariomycetidae sp. FL0641]|nr:RNA-binding domain-containing protein [Xylariomycetidae sp. FL0641]
MHSVRRAALRAACSSSRVVAVPRQQVASFALNIGKTNLRPAAILPISRYFSQTARVAEEQDKDAIVEEAIDSTEQTTTAEGNAAEQAAKAAAGGISVFVSNITFDATEAHLEEAFSKFGTINKVNIGRDSRGLSRGFAFVVFQDQAAADQAVNETNQSFWHGRRIRVEHRKPPTQARKGNVGEPTKSLYIGNIPYETSDADLNALFRELDNVTDVRVAVDRNTGWPRGFAHADFNDVESAQKACEKLAKVELGGRPLRVDYAETKRMRENRS